ncbi:O-antigen ligase family protein [Immundisolibacter sp.]|uniref:O-antigen ligase family protein n=1 Tax=Immundisolibacter sp. TaxID=1934948 RepID=UPI003F86D0F4
MTEATRWARWRRHGPERLTPALAVVLACFFLVPSGKGLNNSYYALVLAPALLMVRFRDWSWLAGQRLGMAVVALLGYLTVSGWWSVGVSAGEWWHEAKALPYLLVYLATLACVVARRPDSWERALRFVMLAAAAGTLISIALFYQGQPWSARLRYHGPVYNPNEAAMMLGVCLLVVVFHVLPAARQRVMWVGVALILFGGVVLTGSRMPLAAVLASAGLGGVLLGRWRLLAGVTAATLAVVTLLLVSGHGVERLLQRGDSYRLAVWQSVAERIAQRPWSGEGALTDDSVQVPARAPRRGMYLVEHPHNIYLSTTLYGGVPALALLMCVLLFAAQTAWGLAAGGRPAWLLALTFSALCMMTDGARLLNSPQGIWFYFWLPVGVLLGYRLRPAIGGASDAAPGAWPASVDRSE